MPETISQVQLIHHRVPETDGHLIALDIGWKKILAAVNRARSDRKRDPDTFSGQAFCVLAADLPDRDRLLQGIHPGQEIEYFGISLSVDYSLYGGILRRRQGRQDLIM